MNEDKYIWMENLNDPRVKVFIEEENKRFREFVKIFQKKLVARSDHSFSLQE